MKKFLDYLPSTLIVLGYFVLVGFLGFFIMFFEKSISLFIFTSIILGLFTIDIVVLLNKKNEETKK